MDYGSRKAGSRPASDKDNYYPIFYLDFICIEGAPLQPISRRSDRFFDNVTISFQHWQAPYSVKRGSNISFDLTNRTFRVAVAATREQWFIVMHPIRPGNGNRKRRDAAKHGTGMVKHHAEALASYIKSVFTSGELLGEGIEAAWKLGGRSSQQITYNKWTMFQEIFMDGWASFVEMYAHETFWSDNLPAFHAYDYGANIEMEVTEGVQNLPRETRIRPDDDDEDDDVEEEDEDSDEERRYQGDMEEESEVDSEEEQAVEPSLFVQDPNEQIAGAANGATSRSPLESQDEHFSPGLLQLRTELEHKYNLDHLTSISYAVATNLHCTTGGGQDQDQGQAVCLLADRNCLAREYASSRDYTFYPLGFHSAYGNFSSPKPPAFLKNNLLAIIEDNMSFSNQGADVVSFTEFQGYCALKSVYRHRADALLASQGSATAALTVPEADIKAAAKVGAKQARLLDRIRGRLTPENPGASKPFEREALLIEKAIEAEEFSYRFEQVVTVHVQRLIKGQKSFSTVLQPIVQMKRFFLKEKQSYSWILRRFLPPVFPGVLIAFARTFKLAIEEMERRFTMAGSRGLGLAASEAVAALDRLGNFCLTGDPRILPSRVFRLLGTMESLQHGGWPFIDPAMLDFREGEGSIHIGQWPHLPDDRPMLMHVASLAFHYGPAVAANRHSQLWFSELGGQSIQGISGASRFLEKVLAELWIPQMSVFMGNQFHRKLNRGIRSGRGEPSIKAGQELKAWEDCHEPFRWR